MRTSGTRHKRIRKAVLGALRHMPKVRLMVRHGYWAVQGRRYAALARRIDVDTHRVFFESYGGRSYACSPRALYEFMKDDARFAGWTFVWSFKRGYKVKVPELAGAVIVERGSRRYFEELARAGVLVLNTRMPEYVAPKPGQTYIQCWHGTPLKRLGFDVKIASHAALNTTSELAERFGLDAKKWTYLLSPSPYTSERLCSAFGLKESSRASTVIEEGYPRNDVLARARMNRCSAGNAPLRARLGIPGNKKVLLYAPTWRDDSYEAGTGYVLDYLLDFDELEKSLSGEWVVLFRAHYYIANRLDMSAWKGFVYDISRLDDVNDAYLAADVLVTDYSSVLFDYANLRRPMLLYMPDKRNYEDAIRGFYFDPAEIPAPVCETQEELVEALSSLDSYWIRYGGRYESFCMRFTPLDDGGAARRVVERVVRDGHL